MIRGEQKLNLLKKRLNREQLSAVETIYGALLVIAGPGTGKTELLSARVANILAKTDTDASGILCLTFTNKAAINMRKRLLELIGPAAKDVQAKTFHSFAAEIISQHPQYFWAGARLSVVPQTVQLDTVASILGKLPLSNTLSLRFAGVLTMVDSVMEALQLAKEAGLTPQKLETLLRVNLTYINAVEPALVDALVPNVSIKNLPKLERVVNNLPQQGIDEKTAPLISLSTLIKESFALAKEADLSSGKLKNISKWKARWIQNVAGERAMHKERQRNQWWLAVADVYANYRDQLHARGHYDYADMLVEVNYALEQNPDLLSEVQERFGFVLIDEFQDTNPAQMRLAHLVADHPSAEGKPNIMAVGDDDQSIFRFQGAELNNILAFSRRYKASKLIVLKDNYRSSQQILSSSERIIAMASDRLVYRYKHLNKQLNAANPPKRKGLIKHYHYPTREHQFSAVAKQIKAERSKTKDIAVLSRNHDGLRRLASVLTQIGVPVRYEQQQNVLEHPAVKQLILIAQIVSAISSGDSGQVNFLLSQTLRHPMWGIKPASLWQLALKTRSNEAWLDNILKHPDKHLRQIGQWLVDLSQNSSVWPLPLTLEYIIGLRGTKDFKSPLKDYYLKAGPGQDYLHAISAIQLLRAMSEEFASGQEAILTDFVRMVEISKDSQTIITDESPFVTDKNAVQLLTVFKAKGLEFDSVFVIDAVEDNWRPRLKGRTAPANLPLKPQGEEDDDYARLMFVAASRARHTFIAASFAQDHAGNQLLATPLISETIKDTEIVEASTLAKPIEILEQNIAWPTLGKIDEKETLKARLEEYSLSVTGLLNFLDLEKGGPEYFKERNILRLPEAKTPALAFGTAMHDAMEAAQLLANKKSFNLTKVKRLFSKSLVNQHLPPVEHQRRELHGHATLDNLFKKIKLTLPVGGLPEQKLNAIKIGSAYAGGKLDRIDSSTPGQLTIADYKTGTPLINLNSKNKSQQIKAWRLRSQLIYYAMLAQNSPRFRKYHKIIGQMIYLEAPSAKQLSATYTPSQDEIDQMARLVSAIWPKIVELDFPDTSLYSKDYAGIMQFQADLLSGKI